MLVGIHCGADQETRPHSRAANLVESNTKQPDCDHQLETSKCLPAEIRLPEFASHVPLVLACLNAASRSYPDCSRD